MLGTHDTVTHHSCPVSLRHGCHPSPMSACPQSTTQPAGTSRYQVSQFMPYSDTWDSTYWHDGEVATPNLIQKCPSSCISCQGCSPCTADPLCQLEARHLLSIHDLHSMTFAEPLRRPNYPLMDDHPPALPTDQAASASERQSQPASIKHPYTSHEVRKADMIRCMRQ